VLEEFHIDAKLISHDPEVLILAGGASCFCTYARDTLQVEVTRSLGHKGNVRDEIKEVKSDRRILGGSIWSVIPCEHDARYAGS
jgi:hypothetical protein